MSGHDEQRVRVMAGQVGVEISRSRVRTEGKPGFGLYRVRGSVPHLTRAELDGLDRGAMTSDGLAERTPWTPYAFRLEDIRAAVVNAIEGGWPDKPAPLRLCAWPDLTPEYRVLTRWTSAYRGPRNLGVPDEQIPVAVKPEFIAEVRSLADAVDAGLVTMTHVKQACVCSGTSQLTAACVTETLGRPLLRPESVRERQQAFNRQFQEQHLKEREWGLKQRHAAKLFGNRRAGNTQI